MTTPHENGSIEGVILSILNEIAGRDVLPGSAAAHEVAAFRYLEAGVIDSMGIVGLIGRLEQEFGIRFTGDDMRSEGFQTLGGLAGMLKSKTGAEQ